MTGESKPPEKKELRLFDLAKISDDEAIEKYLESVLGPEKDQAPKDGKDDPKGR